MRLGYTNTVARRLGFVRDERGEQDSRRILHKFELVRQVGEWRARGAPQCKGKTAKKKIKMCCKAALANVQVSAGLTLFVR